MKKSNLQSIINDIAYFKSWFIDHPESQGVTQLYTIKKKDLLSLLQILAFNNDCVILQNIQEYSRFSIYVQLLHLPRIK